MKKLSGLKTLRTLNKSKMKKRIKPVLSNRNSKGKMKMENRGLVKKEAIYKISIKPIYTDSG